MKRGYETIGPAMFDLGVELTKDRDQRKPVQKPCERFGTRRCPQRHVSQPLCGRCEHYEDDAHLAEDDLQQLGYRFAQAYQTGDGSKRIDHFTSPKSPKDIVLIMDKGTFRGDISKD